MKKLILLIPIGLLLLMIACRKDSINTTNTDTVGGPQILIETGVFGLVKDLNDQPVEGATVYFDNQQAITDNNGYFRIAGRGDSKQAAIRVEKSGYFPSFAGFVPEKGVDARLEVVLQPKNLVGSLTASNGGTITFGNGNKIDFAANAFKDANGQAYSGTILVYAMYLDPSQSSTLRTIPGSFAGINAEGERQFLESYGMAHVLLETPGGQRLNISQPATVTMAIPADRAAFAPPTIPLWYLDETTGLWREEGEAVLQGGRYVGQVSHFSLWNCDAGFPVVTLSGNVFVENYHPIVEVRITRQNGAGVRSTFTNSLGNFSGGIPVGETLVLEILNSCGDVLYTANIGPFNADANLNSISLPWNSDWVAVSGTLVDCNAQPVTNGYVSAVINSDNAFPLTLDPTNGQFKGMTSNCGSGGSTISVYGVDLDAGMESDVLIFPVSSQVNVGTVSACAGQLSDGADFVFNGNTLTYTPCTAKWLSSPTLSNYEISFTANFPDGSVKYTVNLVDWNNGTGTPLWAYSTQHQIFGNPTGYYTFSGGDIEVIQHDTNLGGKLIMNIHNVTFDQVPPGTATNGTVKIVATIQ